MNTHNKTAQLVQNHLDKAKDENKVQDESNFEQQAILVNGFNLAVTPAFCRLTAFEATPSGTKHLRASLACDYKSLGELHALISRLLAFLDAQEKQKGVADETQGNDNAEITNGSQTKVGE